MNGETTVKKRWAVLALAATIAGCGLIDGLKGKGDKPAPPEPVAYQKLTELLPEPEGWDVVKPEGKFSSVGATRVSLATATYTKELDEAPKQETPPPASDEGASSPKAADSKQAAAPAGDTPENGSGAGGRSGEANARGDAKKPENDGTSGQAADRGEPGKDAPQAPAAAPKRQTVSLQILDGNHVPSAYAPLALISHSAGEADVHKMQIKIGRHTGIQQWKPETGKVHVLMLIARRFMITLNGEHVSPQTVKQYLKAIDLDELASWEESKKPPVASQ
jgi:hypothetical protein